MRNTATNIGQTQQKKSWRPSSAREVLQWLLGRNPGGDKEDHRHACWDVIRASEALSLNLHDDWFDIVYAEMTKPPPRAKTRPGSGSGQPNPGQPNGATTAATAELSARVRARIAEEARVVLLDLMLPTGKTVRDSTREELQHVGGWAHRVAERLRPNQTVAQANLTEAELWRLYRLT